MASRGARSGAALTVLVALVAALGASPHGLAGASPTSAPTTTVGYVDVVAPVLGTRSVEIPVTLSAPAPTRLTVDVALVGGSAVVGQDVSLDAGAVAFPAGAVETFVHVTVRADRARPSTTCFADVGVPCRTFTIALEPVAGDVAVVQDPAPDAILTVGSSANAVELGDVGVVQLDPKRRLTAPIPATLAEPATGTVAVDYRLVAGSALPGVQFDSRPGTFRLGTGATGTTIDVWLPPGPQTSPSESVRVSVSGAIGALVARATGFVIVQTGAAGLADPAASAFAAATLTQVATPSGHTVDEYALGAPPAGAAVAAAGPIQGANDRLAFWPATEVAATDEEACATWSSQVPTQVVGVIDQQGLVLRAASVGGVTRAITITKNIWAGAFDVLNIHLWDTAWVVPFKYVANLNLEGYFARSHEHALPYDVCARVEGRTLQVAFWFPNEAVPTWTTPGQTTTVRLPASWTYPGTAGFYVGHLATGASTLLTGLYAGPPEVQPSAQPSAA